MTVEVATYPTQLDITLPEDTDLISEGAAQIRLVKEVLSNAFPTVSAPITAAVTDLNKVGVTQAQTSNDTSPASTAYVQTAILNASLSATLPAQSGNGGKFLKTDGSTSAWAYLSDYEARTSNTILGQSDDSKLIDITSGTFSQTFTAAATLGDGWKVALRNSGTGTITLDPNGAETIDGSTTLKMYPGETYLVFCTGSAFVTYSAGTPGDYETIMSTPNGYGATSTKIGRWTTTQINTGSGWTIADDANTGGSLTCVVPGVWEVSLQGPWGATAALQIGVSVNTTTPTTDIQSIAASERLLYGRWDNTVNSDFSMTRSKRFAVGDVVRLHGNANVLGTSSLTTLCLRRVAR